eukprot:6301001-Alexandrium_andersonii.AAC.1
MTSPAVQRPNIHRLEAAGRARKHREIASSQNRTPRTSAPPRFMRRLQGSGQNQRSVDVLAVSAWDTPMSR